MAFAILRVEKHKTPGTLGSALQHALRERETPNADPDRARLNVVAGARSARTGVARMRAMFDKLECKPRHKSGKNAPVLALEYFVGMSPEAAAAKDRKAALAYLDDAVAWFIKRHGAHNMIGAQMHFDESTPHASIFVFPEKNGQLNAKSFTGGRALLGQMQSDFARDVGAKHGLQRGAERSKATHVAIADWYKVVGERDQLRTEVKELRVEVARLTTEVDRLTGVLNALEPALRDVIEERAARAMADAETTKASPSAPERSKTRFTGPAIRKKP